jgi:hypothetical protein
VLYREIEISTPRCIYIKVVLFRCTPFYLCMLLHKSNGIASSEEVLQRVNWLESMMKSV